MGDSNTLLVRLELGEWNEFVAFLAKDFGVLDYNYQIYVPNRFILGNFKRRKGLFKLSPNGFFYKDSEEFLHQYQDYLDKGKLEIVKSLSVPEEVLGLIEDNGKAYADARKQLSKNIQHLL